LEQIENTHNIKELLGEDKQGKIFSTQNAGIILRNATPENDHARYDDVKLLPLQDIENIILPGHYLPEGGYIMTIPEDYVPLSTIMTAPDANAAEAAKFYVQTGGLKRRLALLADLAKTLLKLHSLPCMYGSLSPVRIFISSDSAKKDILLLYSVKMAATMPPHDNDNEPYTAPEARDGLASLHSDIYSFGALAQDLLTAKNTIPLTDELAEMLNRAVSETASERPRLINIYRLLMTEMDSLLTCQGCSTDFHYTAEACFACGGKSSKALKGTIYDTVNETRIDRGVKIFEFSTNKQTIFNHLTNLVLLGDKIEPRIDCVINIAGKKLHFILKNMMDKDIIVNDETIVPEQAKAIPLPIPLIRIEFLLHSSVTRTIDLVII